MPEVDVVVVRNFLIALMIGALVGIERERHKVTEQPATFAGPRALQRCQNAPGLLGPSVSLLDPTCLSPISWRHRPSGVSAPMD